MIFNHHFTGESNKIRRWLEIIQIGFFSLIFLLIVSDALACVGARSLSMGGAFTGVADDTQATYWNPAGLAKAPSGLYTMHNVNHRREFNYDDYIGISSNFGNWGVGFEYVGKSNQFRTWMPLQGYGVQLCEIDDEATWIQLGGGFSLSFFSIGANIRFAEQTLEITCNHVMPPFYTRGDDSTVGLDVGFLTEFGPRYERKYKRMFSAGLLIQDINEPELLGDQYIVNFRPGLGFRPTEDLLFSLELYDAAQQYFEEPQIRIGSEWLVMRSSLVGELVFRAGVYHLNNPDYRALTGGLGFLKPVSKNVSFGLDYAFMGWEKAEKITHLLSFICRF